VATVYRKVLSDAGRVPVPADASLRPRVHRSLLNKSVTVSLATVGLFFAGQPIALVALVAAGVLLLGRVRPEKVFRSVDWPLLVMFAGLFVVVHAFEANVVHT
jgi:Na+/H+ antiporter NhaD/arsenite permease-like protein